MSNLSKEERALRMAKGMQKRAVYMKQYRQDLLQKQLDEQANKNTDDEANKNTDHIKKDE